MADPCRIPFATPVQAPIVIHPTSQSLPPNRCPQVAGEEELLFSAYAAFRVLEFHPPKSGDGASREDPFRITLEAHYDNAMVSENIPSAPWH